MYYLQPIIIMETTKVKIRNFAQNSLFAEVVEHPVYYLRADSILLPNRIY
jgi:hypothetical protein